MIMRGWCATMCLLLIVLTAGCALPRGGNGNLQSLEDYCQTSGCEPSPGAVSSRGSGGAVVHRGALVLRLGESWSVHVDEHEGYLVLKEPASEDAEGQLFVSMEYTPGVGTMLTVRNPSKRFLRYRLGIRTGSNGAFWYTSSCPVNPGILGIETWPQRMGEAMLTDLQLLYENDPRTRICN